MRGKPAKSPVVHPRQKPKTASSDPRKSHSWEIRGLTTQHFSKLKRTVGYSGPIDSQFYHRYVWWWRELEQVLGSKARLVRIPQKAKRSYFPKDTFQHLEFSEHLGGINEIIDHWFFQEFAARTEGTSPPYPAFDQPFDWDDVAGFRDWRKWAFAEKRIKIDFRKSDNELINDFSQHLVSWRAERHHNFAASTRKRNQKNTTFHAGAFALLELIDQKFAPSIFPETISNNKWANVRAMLRKKSGMLEFSWPQK